MDYQWEIETLADCADGLDAANLRELIQTLRADGQSVLTGLVDALETNLNQQVEDGSLCPNCFNVLQVRMKTYHSNGWHEPPGSWEEVDGAYCGCGYKE